MQGNLANWTEDDTELLAMQTLEVPKETQDMIPPEYHDYLDVFDLKVARKLPPL